MNANELADDLDNANGFQYLAQLGLASQAATMLRQQQAEIEALKSELDRAVELYTDKAIENEALKYEKSSGVYDDEPVAWIDEINTFVLDKDYKQFPKNLQNGMIPLYTHPAKELHLSLQKVKDTGELLAVTYTDDEHRIVEVLWQKPPAKTLTDEEILEIGRDCARNPDINFQITLARAILKKASEK
jgi:hypothetical protein